MIYNTYEELKHCSISCKVMPEFRIYNTYEELKHCSIVIAIFITTIYNTYEELKHLSGASPLITV